MILLLILGLIFTVFSYFFEIAPGIALDVLPDFVGFLLIWHVGNKLEEKTKWFKEASIFAAILAAIHFIGFASSLRGLLPQNTTFADSDILRFILSGVGVVYENGYPIFYALGFVPLIFLCLAFRKIAKRDDNRPLSAVCLVFLWIFIILIPVYIAVEFTAFPIEGWWLTVPIVTVFAIVSAIIMKKYKLD